MTDPATYRKYAEECRRLATRAPENDRRLLLEHADVWLKLAEEAERNAARLVSVAKCVDLREDG
jgi:hypothetical protein